MMDFLKLVSKRQSDRKYVDRPVDKDIINRCIEAARLAPSACNAQPWKFIVVDNPELKNRLADATTSRVLPMNHFTKQAPVHVVIVREPANITSRLGTAIKDREFPLIDIGIAAAHFCLQATSEGLGTCILGWFNEKKVRELLKIPLDKRPELIITLGYPSGTAREKRRKPHEKIVSFNQYTES